MNYFCFLTEFTDVTDFFFANEPHRALTVKAPPRPSPKGEGDKFANNLLTIERSYLLSLVLAFYTLTLLQRNRMF